MASYSTRVGFVSLLLLTFFVRSAHADEDASRRRAAARKRVNAGLGTLAAGYAAPSLAAAAFYRHDDGSFPAEVLVPIVGPWLMMANKNLAWKTSMTSRVARSGAESEDCQSRSGRDGESSSGWCGIGTVLFLGFPMLLVEFVVVGLAPVTQATGLILALTGSSEVEATGDIGHAAPKPKVKLVPTVVGSGVGLSLAITQW